MPEAARVIVPTKKTATKTGRPAHRPVVVGVVRTRTVKFDQELEDMLQVEYAIRRQLYKEFDSLDEAQAFLDHWQRTVADVRKHGTTQRVVHEHFAEEAPHLRP